MGRLGPLTSMALGRSPYDDVVMGQGEGDPRAPLQMYDERGRPVNPETKRVNKDIIRSHNEVMLVIGVVESENSIEDMRAEQLRRYEHERHDDSVGRDLDSAARICQLGGVWGLAGLRHRILLYKEYSHIPFSRLFQVERQTQSPTSLWLHGLPTFVVSNCRTHLLPASASPWVPSWKFFVPFTDASVIAPCAPPTSLNPRSIVGWLGRIGWGMAPFIGYWAVSNFFPIARNVLYEVLYDMMPAPSNPEQSRPSGTPVPNSGAAADHTTEVRSATPSGRPDATAPATATPTAAAAPSRPRSHPRRSRTANTEDFSSDDEATEEVVSATLISFDVENNPENPDPTNDNNIPPGVWSAELRPNPGNDSPTGRDGDDGPGARRRALAPVYRDNVLTQLPAKLATSILVRRLASLMLAPVEASALRSVAWSWCRTRGMSTAGLWEPVWLWPFVAGGGFVGFRLDFRAGFSLGSFCNFMGVELVHFMLDACLWSVFSLAASSHMMSGEEWERALKETESTEQQ
ncbi:hypothetical protein M406DRAFT_245913 [Cryphonectria parasitica EP155]|uniref:Uncharacterized protein n=1 Tax=Cryphonectria parasitica (strain ATCC 38755 / EP155) TaxID=660469 RepID=A0A9P5CTM3_CRYP1|nr:uncharacterized protein M406DRAFT_245913 [Cryphonectria parasitica EP155]KAF3770779.1 hypothetical protein M406DRAFT_245913 [Cryphonectria parasitica EP155]